MRIQLRRLLLQHSACAHDERQRTSRTGPRSWTREKLIAFAASRGGEKHRAISLAGAVRCHAMSAAGSGLLEMILGSIQ